MDVLTDTHAPEDHSCLCGRKVTCHSADCLRINPAQFLHLFRWEPLQVLLLSIPVFGKGCDVLFIIKALFDDHVHDAVQHRHVGAWLKLQHMRREPFEALVTRIHHDQLATTFGELLEIGCGNRVVLERVGPDHDGHISILNLVERGSHSAGANVFNQCGNG